MDRASAIRLQRLLDNKTIVAVGQRLADKLAKDSSWILLEKELQNKFDEHYNKVKSISGYFLSTELVGVLGTPLLNNLSSFILSLNDNSPIKKLTTGIVLSNNSDFIAAQNIFNTGHVNGQDPSLLLSGNVDAEEIVKNTIHFFILLQKHILLLC